MSPKIKVLIINLLLIIICLAAIENISKFIDKSKLLRKNLSSTNTSFEDIYNEAKLEFRKPQGLFYNEQPIILFGCSYAYGLDLEEEQTPSNKLSKITKRPVYNRSYWGWGIQHMLYQLTVDNKSFSEIKSPKYIIYIFIPQHITRRLEFRRGSMVNPLLFLSYRIKNNNLERYDSSKDYWKGLYIIRKLDSFFFNLKKDNAPTIEQNIKFKLFTAHIDEIKKSINNIYPDTKFVILLYEQYEHWTFKESYWDEIKQKGITVINTKELTKKNLGDLEYILGVGDLHPNEKAWEEILPKLAEKLENT